MKIKFTKKIVSLVTVLAIAVGLMPTNITFAADELKPTVTKSAKWVDIENQIAEVQIVVEGKAQTKNSSADIVFVVDTSGSMDDTDIKNVKSAITTFTSDIKALNNNQIKIGIVNFNETAKTIMNLSSDYASVEKNLKNLKTTDLGTNIQAGLKSARDMLAKSTADNKYIVLLGDGAPTYSYQAKGKFSNAKFEDHEHFNIVKWEWEHDYYSLESIDFDGITGINYNELEGTGYTTSHNGKVVGDDVTDPDGESHSVSESIPHKDVTIYEAGLAKKSAKIFSIAYGLDSKDTKAIETLKGVATSESHYYNSAATSTSVSDVMTAIKNSIKKDIVSAKDAKITENDTSIKIGSTAMDYDIITTSVTVAGGSVSGVTATNIDWNIPTVPANTDDGKAILTYRVKFNGELPAGNNSISFDESDMQYTDSEGSDDTTKSTSKPTIEYSKHTVKFVGYTEDANGNLVEKVLKTETALKGETVTAPSLSETAGYTFAWPQNSVTVSDEDVTITAEATKKKFNVTFNVLNTETGKTKITDVLTLDYGTELKKIVIPNVYPEDGYEVTKDFDKSIVVKKDITVTAEIAKKVYDVEFFDFGKNKIGETQEIKHGESATAPETNPTAIDKNFTGWGADFSNVTSNMEIYPKGVTKTFDITLTLKNLETNEVITKVTEDIEYGTKTADITMPTFEIPEGYEIISNFDLPDVITTDVEAVQEIALKQFTVSFYDFDGNVINSTLVKYGQDATAPETNPTAIDKDFEGWDVDFTNVTSNMEIHPKGVTKEFEVKFFDFDGNKIGETQIVKYGEDATAPAAPTADDKTFDGWDKAFTNVTENIDVKATFTTIIPDVDIPQEDIPQTDIPKEEIPQADIPEEEIPQTDIPEEEIPQTDIPEEEIPQTDIPEEDVPQSNNPKTSATEYSVVAILLSALVCLAVVYTNKKFEIK